MNPVLATFKEALLALDRVKVRRIIEEQSASGDPIQAFEALAPPTLDSIGKDWSEGRLALSQVYMTGRLCEDLIDSLIPSSAAERPNQPRIAVCVMDDFHMLGKRLVHSAMRVAGYHLIDYDRVQPEELVEYCLRDRIDMALVSTLMLPSALKIREARDDLNKHGGKDVRLIVGGAPFRFDPDLFKEVGADATTDNASKAPALVEELWGGGR